MEALTASVCRKWTIAFSSGYVNRFNCDLDSGNEENRLVPDYRNLGHFFYFHTSMMLQFC